MRRAGAEVFKKLREGLIAGTEKDDVGVRSGFCGKRGDVETAKADKGADAAVVVGDLVRAVCVGDVDLDDDEVGRVVERERLDVLVDDDDLVVRREIGSERGEAEGREQRVLDGTPVRIGSLSKRGQDELDVEAAGWWKRRRGSH